MFNKNLEVIKEKNPALAEKLVKISLEEAKTKIEVYQAESKDIILSYEGLALDDIYDPIRVAKTNWNINVTTPLKKFDIVVVYGLGLGYLFKRAYVSCEARILLVEPKIDILRYVLEYVDFSKELADSRVYISSDTKDALSYLEEKYLADDNLVFIYPKAYTQLLTKEMGAFTNDVVNVCDMKKMDTNTVSMLTKYWCIHSLKNILYMDKILPFSWLKNKFENKTFLIAAAGPSLADNIEKIKNNREKFILCAVNRTVPVLFDNGLVPDFVVVSDVFGVAKTIEGYEEQLSNSYIIADSRANNLIYKKFNNILTYFSKNDLISQHLQKVTNNAFDLMETAGTAAAQAFNCAKILGAKNVIFAGLDLAFKGEQLYADGQKIELDAANNLVINEKANHKKSLVKVKDLNGDDIYTRDDYALFIRQFEEMIAKNSDIKTFNISDFGALINGMSYLDLEAALQTTQDYPAKIKDEIDLFRVDKKSEWINIHEKILTALKDKKTDWSIIREKVSLLLAKELELKDKINSGDVPENISEEFIRLSKEFSGLLPVLVDEPCVSQYFQSEFMNFVKTCDTTTANTIVLTNIKEAEIKILDEVKNICEKWIGFIDRHLK